MTDPRDFLDREQSETYLEIARSIGRSVPIIDAHVHATEVIFAETSYEDAAEASGVWSATDRPFSAPVSGTTRLSSKEEETAKISDALRARVSQMAFTRTYQHIGPSVLEQHMRLAGVTHALLLPVARQDAPIGEQMSMLHRFAQADPRFLLAYSLRPQAGDGSVEDEIASARDDFGISAVKLHPNISDFDVEENHAWMEEALAACGALGLPVIVHGGRSPIYPDRRRSHHATLENLRHVDWSATKDTVVISHFGVYGYTRDEVDRGQLALLDEILDRHENVVLDTSGVGYEVLHHMLSRLDHKRVIYGSDALYFPMWQGIVLLLHVLKELSNSFEESFVRIASENPVNHLKLLKESA
jgi:predicted TIM-barrel fold metal-dependent hydrolase